MRMLQHDWSLHCIIRRLYWVNGVASQGTFPLPRCQTLTASHMGGSFFLVSVHAI